MTARIARVSQAGPPRWLALTAAMAAACSSNGAAPSDGGGAGGSGSPSNGGSATGGTSSTGGESSSGGAEVGPSSGGETGTGGALGPASGGSQSMPSGGADQGSGGGSASGGAGPACPKPNDEICHEFFVSDNGRHQIIYVNEFEPTKNWTQSTADTTGGNSPRQLQIVDNENAQDGRALLVSVDSGYEEYDYVTHALLDSKNLGAIGVRGVQRLPSGQTIVGYGDAKLRLVDAQGMTVGQECDMPGAGEETLRVLSYDPSSELVYYGRGSQAYAITLNCEQKWTASFPDPNSKAYLVLPQPGGGAWAATGSPGSVIEFDEAGQVVNEVGGVDQFPGVIDFASGFSLTDRGNVLVASWWGHVVPPPEEGPHLIEFTLENELVWTWGTQEEASQATNVLLVR